MNNISVHDFSNPTLLKQFKIERFI